MRGALFQALLQPGRGVGGIFLTRLALLRNILETDCHRIHADLFRKLVEHLLERPGALRMARSPERTGRARVDVDVLELGRDVRAGVEVLDQPVEQGGAPRTIRAAGGEPRELQSRQGTVLLDASPQLHRGWRAVAHGQERGLAANEHLDWTARLLGQQGGNDGVLARLELATESTSDVVADDANPRQRQTQHLRHLGLNRVNALGGLPNRELVPVPLRNTSVELERRVQLAGGSEVSLDHDVGFVEAAFHVAARIGFGRLDPVASVVNLRRVIVQRLSFIDHEWQNLVIDRDGAGSVRSHIRGFRGHRGHGIALVTAVRIEELALVATAVGPDEIGGWRVAGQHGMHAPHRLGLGGGHALHVGVGVGAAHDCAVEHIGERNVRGVDGGAADSLVSIYPVEGLTHDPGGLPRFGRDTGVGRLGDVEVFSVVNLAGISGHHSPPPSHGGGHLGGSEDVGVGAAPAEVAAHAALYRLQGWVGGGA